jgi:anthranilate synthase component 1
LNLTKDHFLSLAQSHNTIPICEELVFDAHTPLAVFNQFKQEDSFVFLEGLSTHQRYGRYSYLALDPYKSLLCYENSYNVIKGDLKETFSGTVYDALETELAAIKYPDESPEFYSGIIGNLSYECLHHLDAVTPPKQRSLKTPYASFMIPKTLLVFDTLYHKLTIVRVVFLDGRLSQEALETLYDDACNEIVRLKEKCATLPPIEPVFLFNDVQNYDDIDYTCNITKEEFLSGVTRCKKYIFEGDIFQVQLSRRASMPYQNDPFLLYRYLRNFNPSPLLFYIKLANYCLVGASPEILVNVEDNQMRIRPIAGTRKRYSRSRSEAEIIEELVTDEKEKAEHIMLVDLARNDVGRACNYDSVSVNDLMIIEKYAHVIHMVSDVSGNLREDASVVDALKYGFPAGTVTGAPKIRAMEIIAELEHEQREFYSGGVVFFDFKNNLKSALTIRSICVVDQVAYTQAAAGIVADSIEEMEFKESENKMRSCLSAMAQCGRLS